MADHRYFLARLQAEEAVAKGSNGYGYGNYGINGAFNNNGNGNQDLSGAVINSGLYSADCNRLYTSNNYGSPTFNNSGNFHGDGNGSYYRGNYDASTRGYYY